MSGRYRVVSSVCICSALLAVGAGGAFGYTGTRQGKRLAAELLASYKNVHYLVGSVHGSVYYCPQETGGYAELTGFPAPASCAKHPAKVAWVNTLSRGKGASAVGTVTASNEPTITFVARKTATFIKPRGAHCWTKQSVDYSFVGYPPFAFFPKEYMSVGPKRDNRIDLLGRMSGFGGFKETDTLNAQTHQMIGESIFFGTKHKSTEDHLLTSYHSTRRAPTVPDTSPVC